MTDIATALDEARRAALAAQNALRAHQDASPHFTAALKARRKATKLDPTFADPAWEEDVLSPPIAGIGRVKRRDKRLTDAQVIADQNASLIQYYRLQLGEVENPTQLSSQLENVIVPDDWRTVKPGIRLCSCGHPYDAHTIDDEACDVPACPCLGYAEVACKHAWEIAGQARTCAACGEAQKLFPTMALEETEAFKQIQKERKAQ